MADSGFFPEEINGVNNKDNLGNTALHRSVSNGELGRVKQLLTQPGIDINSQTILQETPLILAAKSTTARQVPGIMTALLKQPAIAVNVQDKPDSNTALMYAVKENARLQIKALLEHESTETSLTNRHGNTALTAFLREGPKEDQLEVLEWFLRHPRLDVNHSDHQGHSVLSMAVSSAGKTVVERLLQHPDIQVNQPDKKGYTALMYLVRCGEPNQETLDLLLNHPTLDVNVKTSDDSSWALMLCNQKDTLIKLLDHPKLELHLMGKDHITKFRISILPLYNELSGYTIPDIISRHPKFHVNEIRGDGHTDLTWAIKNRREKHVSYLLQHPDIQVSQCDQNHCSPLMYLAQWFHTDIMKTLMKHSSFDKADFHKKDKDSQTVLHHLFLSGTDDMSQSCDTEFIVSLIQQQDMELRCKDAKGYTALMRSIEFARNNPLKGLADIIHALLDKCTAEQSDHLTQINKYNHTVLDLVKEHGHELEAPIKGIFKKYMLEEDSTAKQYHSNLSVAQQLKHLRKSIHDLKLSRDCSDHLTEQVDKLESDIDVFTGGHYGNEIGMKEVHRKKLIGCHVTLCQNLQPSEVLPYFKEANILTDSQIEEIEAQIVRARVATKLLSILPTRGPEAYDVFIDALNKTKQKYIADELEKFDPAAKPTGGPLMLHNYGTGPVAMATGAREEVVALNLQPGKQMSFTFMVKADEQA